MKRLYTVFFLLSIACGACAVLDDQKDRADLGKDVTWQLTSVGQKSYTLGDRATLEFDTKERTVKGKAACNGFTAEYELLTNQRILFSNIVSTKMYCEGVMDVEQQILTNLEKIRRYEVRSDRLYLYGDNEILITYKR